MSDQPVVLWVDLSVSGSPGAVPPLLGEVWNVRRLDPQGLGISLAEGPPDAICMDFDYPDIEGLSLLEQVKRDHASVPIIMLTVQHSEDLAVWAFRARVWDYLVKPVTPTDARRCIDGLDRLVELRRRQRLREPGMPAVPLPNEARFRSGRTGEEAVDRALQFIQAHYARRLSEPEVARMCGLSPTHFSRVFSRTVGTTFQEYVLRYRVGQACRLMANPSAQLVDIAYSVGFNSASYFSRAFREVTGVTPSAYRRLRRRDPDTCGEAPRPAARAAFETRPRR